MPEVVRRDVEPRRMVSRRTWLAGAVVGWVTAASRAEGPGPAGADADQELRAVEALGTQAGLRPFRTSRTGHYLGIGDARDMFRSLTLRDCEAVAADFLDHYRARGF